MGNDSAMLDAFHVQYVVNGIILPILGVFGVFGNILTMIVLWRREMHSTTILFLRALVLTDTGIIIIAVIGITPYTLSFFHPELKYFKDVIYPLMYTPVIYIGMTVQQINVWVTVSVSVERYISICHPFKAGKICTKRKTWMALIGITVFSIIYNIPRCIAFKAKSPCSVDQPDCYVLVDTDFGSSKFFSEIYMVWMYAILIFILPLTLLSILNTLLIVELMRMRARRLGTNIQDDNEANLSLVLVLIVIVFICCQTPGLFSQFDVIFDAVFFIKWLAFSNTLFVSNSSVNFLIYTAVGRRFRRILLKVFKKLFGRKVLTHVSSNSVRSNGVDSGRAPLYAPVTEETQMENLEKVKLNQ